LRVSVAEVLFDALGEVLLSFFAKLYFVQIPEGVKTWDDEVVDALSLALETSALEFPLRHVVI